MSSQKSEAESVIYFNLCFFLSYQDTNQGAIILGKRILHFITQQTLFLPLSM